MICAEASCHKSGAFFVLTHVVNCVLTLGGPQREEDMKCRKGEREAGVMASDDLPS